MNSPKKDCGGNYLPWGIKTESINSNPETIPNPMCAGCEYVRACAFRVIHFYTYQKELPEDGLEAIRKYSHTPSDTKINVH